MNDGPQYLGIEIGGTKLQLSVGTGTSAELVDSVRAEVDVDRGADGIVETVQEHGRILCERHPIKAVGVGFGGPVDIESGVVTKSHQISGWDNYPLANRLQTAFGCTVRIDNDCNAAALGEAKFGAGQGSARVFYVTVGTGIGGGFVINGKPDGNQRPAISEIGHLRPGVACTSTEDTVENVASGWGIARATRNMLTDQAISSDHKATLLDLCGGHPESLTTKQIGIAISKGDSLAVSALHNATKTLGWAIAQVITLVAPDVVVVGGGVSLVGEPFFNSLRENVKLFAFPPLRNSYEIVPAALGEEVVIHGAIQLAANAI